MNSYSYIIDKINSASFFDDPFKHIYIEDFLSQEHLELLTSFEQIQLPKRNSTEDLISHLQKIGYKQQMFPGCTTSIKDYLNWYNNKQSDAFHNKEIVEGFGMAWRLHKVKNQEVQNLIDFLNSDKFYKAITEKFSIDKSCRISTSIQKYLTGYEISPHPDVRRKALTYLVNINTSSSAETEDVHTHLCAFKDEYKKIYDYWKTHEEVDRCWVPWSWCNSKKQISKNNSLVMFSPDNDTLHAVKLNYNHLNYQRTQLYGNLFFNDALKYKEAKYQNLPL